MKEEFKHTQKGRSILGLLATGVVTILTVGFFLSGVLLFQVISFGLLILVVSSLYAIFRGEEWILGVTDSILHWSYPRWPRSSGEIDLSGVRRVLIDDSSGWLEFRNEDNLLIRIRLLGGAAYKLNDYLRLHFPDIDVKLIDNN